MSSDGRINLEASANFARLENAVVKAQAKIASLEKQLAGATTQFKKGDTAADRFVTTLKRAAESLLIYRGIGTALQAVNAQLEEQAQLSRDALTESERLAAAQLEFFGITARKGLSGNVAQDLLADVQTMAAEAGADVAGMVRAAANVVSASGGELAKPQPILEALREWLPFFRKNTEALGVVASGSVDIQRNLGLSAAESRNLLISTLGEARISDSENIDKISRGIAASGRPLVAEFPERRQQIAREQAAAFAFLGSAIVDPTGELTSTAVTNLGTAIEKTVGETTTLFDGLRQIRTEGLIEDFSENLLGRAVTKSGQEAMVNAFGELETIFSKITTQTTPEISETLKNLAEGTPQLLLDRIMRQIEGGSFAASIGRDYEGATRLLVGPQGALAKSTRGAVEGIQLRLLRAENYAALALGADPLGRFQSIQEFGQRRLEALDKEKDFPKFLQRSDKEIQEDRQALRALVDGVSALIDAIEQERAATLEAIDRLGSTVETTSNASAASAQAGSQKER